LRPEEAPETPPTAAEIRALLLASGFDRVGFASADETPGAARLDEWLARGYAGEMAWIARNAARRRDVREVLDGAQTVIVLATDYSRAGAAGLASPDAARGEISAYAAGTDYHRILEKRLRRACNQLRQAFPGKYFWHVDAGPILEKAWAQKAGIGWIGKNACSIDRERGSYFFLAVILTDRALEPDPPATDHCGSCRACLDACPTDAFPQPRVLDARRCISYLTIEYDGRIDPELAAGCGNLVFGCDICQEVCPFNGRDRDSTGDPDLAPRPENRFPRLAELARLDAATFRDRFPRSPVRRATWRRFLRNAIVAIGNSGLPELEATLETLRQRDDVTTDEMLAATLEDACNRLRGCKIEPWLGPSPSLRSRTTPWS